MLRVYTIMLKLALYNPEIMEKLKIWTITLNIPAYMTGKCITSQTYRSSIILCSRALITESAMESGYISYIFTLRIVGPRRTSR
jgi:hypothetical protein